MTPSVVVFDIGNVLVDWQPHLAWEPELGLDGAHALIERTGFRTLNARADRGETFADLAAEIDDPRDRDLFGQYVALYQRTVRKRVPGTWEILDRLRARAVPVHAITNWSAETWPEGLSAQPRLADAFGVTVVSGQEGIMKPEAAIFHLLCDRAGVAPDACVFIDDARHNVAGARAAGMDAIHFTDASALDSALQERGLL